MAEDISAELAALQEKYGQTQQSSVLPVELKQWFDSSDAQVRLQALYLMDVKHPQALQICQKLIHDSFEEIRKIALEALIQHQGRSVIPVLKSRLSKETPQIQLLILEYLYLKKNETSPYPESLALLMQNLAISFQKQDIWRQDEELSGDDIQALFQTYSHLILAYPEEILRPTLLSAYDSASPRYAFFLLEYFQKLDFDLFLDLLRKQLAKAPFPEELVYSLASFPIQWGQNYPGDLLAPLVKLYFEQDAQILHWFRAVLQASHAGDNEIRLKPEEFSQLKKHIQPYLTRLEHQDQLWHLVVAFQDPSFLPELTNCSFGEIMRRKAA